MAARILANLLIAGGSVLVRATITAYRQAIVNGARAGVNAETVKSATRGSKQMTVQEARQILGLESNASWEEIVKKYDHLMQANEKGGSFYLQSKVYRAKEALETEYKPEQQQQEQ